MTTTSYYTGVAADMEAVLAEIETAAAAGGWTTAIGAHAGTGPDAGDELVMDIGNDYEYTLRSIANLRLSVDPDVYGGMNIDGAGMTIKMAYTGGSLASEPPVLPITDSLRASELYIGPQPTTGVTGGDYLAISFPVTYHIFVYTEPDMIAIVIQTGTISYQWMILGEIHKFGDWVGGGFYGASGVTKTVDSGGSQQSWASYSVTGESTNRSFAPWHRMRTDFARNEQGSTVSNTRLHIITGTSEPEIDDYDWSWNAADNPGNLGGGDTALREVVANPYWIPLAQRSPNSHNEVSVMLPYWLATQRESHRVIVGRQPHIRHIPIDNFNPGDVYELHGDEWIVFPYWQREGITGLEGIAFRRNSGSG